MPYQPTWNNPYLPPNSVNLPYQVPQTVQTYQPQPMPVAPPVNGVIKVNGRDSALQYQLPPNSMSPALFDQNGRTFYIVSTDGAGTKTVEAFDFFPHVEEQPIQIDGAQFVSKQEFDEFAAKVNAVLGVANDGVHAAVPAAAGDAFSTAESASPTSNWASTAAHARPTSN